MISDTYQMDVMYSCIGISLSLGDLTATLSDKLKSETHISRSTLTIVFIMARINVQN
jgi:hypothetical protein